MASALASATPNNARKDNSFIVRRQYSIWFYNKVVFLGLDDPLKKMRRRKDPCRNNALLVRAVGGKGMIINTGKQDQMNRIEKKKEERAIYECDKNLYVLLLT